MFVILSDDGSSVIDTFSLDSSTAVLRVAKLLDRDVATGGFQYFNIVVMATDNGAPQKSVTGTLRVNLNNVNDNPPQFDKSFYNVTLPENTSIGDLVTLVTVTDHDGDSVAMMLTGEAANMFTISGDRIELAKRLDYESTRCLTAIIRY